MPCFKKKVLDFSVSDDHSAFIIEGGYVTTMGSNSEGQSGLGHNKQSQFLPTFVKKIAEKFITVSIKQNYLHTKSNKNK